MRKQLTASERFSVPFWLRRTLTEVSNSGQVEIFPSLPVGTRNETPMSEAEAMALSEVSVESLLVVSRTLDAAFALIERPDVRTSEDTEAAGDA